MRCHALSTASALSPDTPPSSPQVNLAYVLWVLAVTVMVLLLMLLVDLLSFRLQPSLIFGAVNSGQLYVFLVVRKACDRKALLFLCSVVAAMGSALIYIRTALLLCSVHGRRTCVPVRSICRSRLFIRGTQRDWASYRCTCSACVLSLSLYLPCKAEAAQAASAGRTHSKPRLD